MIKPIDNISLNPNRFIPIDREELTALGYIGRITETTNAVVEETNRLFISNLQKVSYNDMKEKYKMSDNANFTGSWYGITHPTFSEPGMANVVMKNTNDIEKLFKDSTPVSTLEELNYQLTENNKFITIVDKIVVGDLTIPHDVTISFGGNGKLSVMENKTLTINGIINADFKTIFEYYDTSKIIADKKEEGNTNIQYDVKVDWFGAKPNCYIPKDNEYLVNGFVIGDDSTRAFKKCMVFLESGSNKFINLNPRRNQSRITLSFKPNGNYYCKGNNPLGIQSTLKNVGYFYGVDGKGCCIYWQPLSQDDALFDKYSRSVSPSIIDLNVNQIGEQGQRWGTFVRSRTGEGDSVHFWTQGIFRNLNLNPQYSSVGYRRVFDIGSDVTQSHDDTTKVENVVGGCYETFMYVNNSEAVNWKFEKCFFASYSPNAIHFNFMGSFSGGLTIDSCEILLAEENEQFFRNTANSSLTPTNIINCRIETRNVTTTRLIYAKYGRVNVTGLNMLSGNGSEPNPNLIVAEIGEKANVNFYQCELFPTMRVLVDKLNNYTYDTCLSFDECSFYTVTSNGAVTLGYPTIQYFATGSGVLDIYSVIRLGYGLRKIVVNNPRYSNGAYTMPITYGNSSCSQSQKTKLYLSKPNGYPKPVLGGALPPMIAIYSVKIFYSGASLDNVDKMTILFRDSISLSTAQIDHNISASPQYGLELNQDGIISLMSKQNNEIISYFTKNGVVVSNHDLIPNGWIEIEYRGITTRNELPSVSGETQKKDMLVFN